jgi:hypothetical protein
MNGEITTNMIKTSYLSSTNGETDWALPVADGTAGYVLSTNGSASLSFTEMVGGGGGTTVQNIEISSFLHTGLISGGALTINAETTKFDIAAGKGVIVTYNTDRNTFVATIIEWTEAKLAIVATVLSSSFGTWVGIRGTGTGTVIQSATPFDAHDTIILGRLGHWDKTDILTASEFPLYLTENTEFSRMAMKYGTINLSGNVFSGSETVGRSLDKSAGKCYRIGANTATLNPNITTLAADTTVTFQRVYINAGVSVTESAVDFTTLNPLQYNNANTLQTVPNGKYTIQTIIIYPFQGAFRMVVLYGQFVCDTFAHGRYILRSYSPEIPSDIFGGNIRGFILIRKECTDLASDIAAGTALIVNGYTHGTHL